MTPLANPPIKEAIISVSFVDPVTMDLLTKFREHPYITQRFTDQRNSLKVEFTGTIHPTDGVEVKPEKQLPLSASHQHVGFVLRSERDGGHQVIKSKIGQLSFHLTHKYNGWGNFVSEFRQLWSIFIEVVGIARLSQISLRYVNEIVLKFPLEKNLNAYLRLLPMLPEGMNSAINKFFIQVDLPNKAETLNSIITETFVTEGEHLKVLLDINVRKDGDVLCEGEEIWDCLDEMRTYKNELFQQCVTSKTLKMCD